MRFAASIYNIFIMETSTAALPDSFQQMFRALKIFHGLWLTYQYSIQLVEDNSVHKYKM